MAAITIRNLPDATHRALKQRAHANERNTEAEVRAILQNVLFPQEQIKLGTALRELGQRFGGLELDITRDRSERKPVSFE